MKRFGRLLPATFLVGFAIAGCGLQSGPPTTTPGTASATSTAPSATATSAPPAVSPGTVSPGASSPGASSSDAQPTDSAAAGQGWTTFTTADGELAFDLPTAWSVQDPAGELPDGGGAFAEVSNAAGKPLATLRTNMATGSTCTEKYPYSVLEWQELPALTQKGIAPRFIYETRGDANAPGPADTPAAAYGITSGPPASGDTACAIFQFFTWPPTAAMFGAFYNPENNQTPGGESRPYLEQARLYMDTAEYHDIKRMITSLRPAG